MTTAAAALAAAISARGITTASSRSARPAHTGERLASTPVVFVQTAVSYGGDGRAEAHARLDDAGHIHWPAVFLYPEFRQSDFIEDMEENTSVLDHLAVMFAAPAPWDTGV